MNNVTQEQRPLPEHMKLQARPLVNTGAIIEGPDFRITVLTERLIRLEYNTAGSFEDRATQTVLNRDFPVPDFRMIDHGNQLEIVTARLQLSYDKRPFTRHGLSIRVRSGQGHLMGVWNYGDQPQNLGGTARTLDNADGAIPLEPGLMSRSGYTIMDDSRSLLLEEDGQVTPREADGTDLYFFGYGHDYLDCLKDFYHLSGPAPLLPRYVLGNWWSRYYRYSAEEYQSLIERFQQERIPFSVAVLDMDWHLVDVNPQYGSGWTGYTWNRELFPDPPGFLAWLHERGLHVTLNVHPADGVRAFEEPYLAIAAELGLDPEQGDAVDFDITDPAFLKAYFKFLHHPLEAEGVDFWWIDWQQGGVTKVPGLDPLWMLNHYHYLDSGRQGKRPLTFSRYAGLGSHRYPVGFSGDTIVTWESLRFQPYFTASAANAGYGWWSHDIGGHMQGYLEDELVMRWVQFGVFSPILRLHSSVSPFNSKEPWRFNPVAEQAMKDSLRLRHRLIPYLYTMNRYASREGLPLVRPLYYHHAEQPEAYRVPNQYYFGTELMACPITSPVDRRTGMAEFTAWLPEGRWFDFFSGRSYTGGRSLGLYRNLESIPVLAKDGAIVPLADLTDDLASTANPQRLEVKVFTGARGHFELWETAEEGVQDRDGDWCVTEMALNWGEAASFNIHAASGNLAALPERRSWRIVFTGVEDIAVKVSVEGAEVACDTGYDQGTNSLTVTVAEIPVAASIQMEFAGVRLAGNRVEEEVFTLLNRAQIEFQLKEQVFGLIKSSAGPAAALASLAALKLEQQLYGALCEILTARC